MGTAQHKGGRVNVDVVALATLIEKSEVVTVTRAWFFHHSHHFVDLQLTSDSSVLPLRFEFMYLVRALAMTQDSSRLLVWAAPLTVPPELAQYLWTYPSDEEDVSGACPVSS